MSLRRMSRPRVFEYIEAIAQTGSIRSAAETLNVASSAVNRMVMDYERELGALIFERHARGVRLTTAGEYLLAHIHESGREFEGLRSRIDGLRNVERGKVTIAAVEAGSGFLTRELGRFHMRHRLIAFDLRMMGSTSVIAAVEQEQVDFGLALDPRPSRQISVVATVRYGLHAFISSDHPLASRDELKISDCVGYPLALGDSTSGGRTVIEQRFEAMNMECRPFLTSNAFAVMIEMARHTDAICFQFMSEREEFAVEGLTAIPVVDSRLRPIDLGIIINARRALPTAAAILVDDLAKALKGHPATG
jgi:DNA-binding transcriptional LysR family regulator